MDKHAAIIISDLKMLLHRMPGLETLAFNDGTPLPMTSRVNG